MILKTCQLYCSDREYETTYGESVQVFITVEQFRYTSTSICIQFYNTVQVRVFTSILVEQFTWRYIRVCIIVK